MGNEFLRTQLLLGSDAMARLKTSRVAVFGIGGVGGHACDGLLRSGIGALELFDADCVAESNINRQLVALHSTLGLPKTDVLRSHGLDINPDAEIISHQLFFGPETCGTVDFSAFDYVVDAIDTVSAKVLLIEMAHRAGVPVISCMGAGNKLDPTAFRVSDIGKTQVCPLARIMRKKLREIGICHLKVVYSEEIPLTPAPTDEAKGTAGRPAPGSVSFVPPVAGLILAGEVVKDLIKTGKEA